MKDIAIIGIGCRFPGDTTSPEEFWELMIEGRDAITEIPKDRWDIKSHYDPDRQRSNKSISKWGGFVPNFDSFDAQFFGISSREADAMDPQQRLMLMAVWESFENAGIAPSSLIGSKTGVFVGVFTDDYKNTTLGSRETVGVHSASGGCITMVSNRVSYVYDLRGPSVTLDTACSSSLVSVHLACQSIWNGNSTMAIAGGTNICFAHETTVGTSKGGFLSPDGRCKAFDESANGYVRSEGVGAVVLKPLADAIADGDPIYATISATGSNQDGRTPGITVPNADSQEALIRQVYADANITADQVGYVEAHGTGTPVGDPLELQALARVYKERTLEEPVLVGSVKTNIGHTEGAAGIAGFIKAALILHKGKIPPNLHFNNPNPNIDWKSLPLEVVTEVTDWTETKGVEYASINSFGFGGTNAHVVLKRYVADSAESEQPSQRTTPYILPISGTNKEGLAGNLKAYADYLQNGDDKALNTLFQTTTRHRDHHSRHRVAIVTSDKETAIEQLESEHARVAGEDYKAVTPATKTAFVYTGMGPQWWAMGRQLLTTSSVFRDAIQECHDAYMKYGNWDLLAEMTVPEEESNMSQTIVAQRANFAIQYALTKLWSHWGISPDVVVGHSVGEVSSSYFSGCLSFEDAIKVSMYRSATQQETAGLGTMLAVGMSQADGEAFIETLDFPMSIAAINGPSSIVFAGSQENLEKVLATLEEDNIFAKFLRVEIAYHSYQMDPLKERLHDALADVTSLYPQMPLYSTVTGQQVSDLKLDAEYWWRNVREPVRLYDTIQQMLADGVNTFIQVGPHPVLGSAIAEISAEAKASVNIIDSLRRKTDEDVQMLTQLSNVYATGKSVTWKHLSETERSGFDSVPTYAWRDEKHWVEPQVHVSMRLGERAHPLLGINLPDPAPTWETELTDHIYPYLKDHSLQGVALFPGSAYIEMGIAAGVEMFGEDTGFVIENVRFESPLILKPSGNKFVRLAVEGNQEFNIFSETDSNWTRNSGGRYVISSAVKATPEPEFDIDELHALHNVGKVEFERFYEIANSNDLEYGDAFKAVEYVAVGEKSLLSKLTIPEDAALDVDDYYLHPILLDAAFQCSTGVFFTKALPREMMGSTYLPVSIDSIEYLVRGGRTAYCYLQLATFNEQSISINLQLIDENGAVTTRVRGLRLAALQKSERDALPLADVARDVSLIEKPLDTEPVQDNGYWIVIGDCHKRSEAITNLKSQYGQRCYQLNSSMPAQINGTFEPFVDLSSTDNILAKLREIDQLSAGVCTRIIYLSEQGNKEIEQLGSAELFRSLADSSYDLVTMARAIDQAYVTQANYPSVTIVASNVHPEVPNPSALLDAPIWGMARVVTTEYPQLFVQTIDVVSEDEQSPNVSALYQELTHQSDGEHEVVLRNNTRYVPRVRPRDVAGIDEKVPAGNRRFRLNHNHTQKILGLEFFESKPAEVGPTEIEIEVMAAGMNYKDVVKATGLMPREVIGETFFKYDLGIECAGVVTRVGAEIEGFKVGDEVIAAAKSSFSSHVVTNQSYAIHKPANLTFIEAATIPVAFLTADNALSKHAKLQAGERVLIHNGSGGVGLAAIQIAQRAGAVVFATAGSEEKRQFLRDMGVEYVMNSRDLKFADQIMDWTNGEGIDVVLNPLRGAALTKGLSLLRTSGRFIHIGWDPDLSIPLGMLENNISFVTLDLERVTREDPGYLNWLLQGFVDKFASGEWEPIHHITYPVSEVQEAIEFMAGAKHIGKIVLTHEDKSSLPLTPIKRPFVEDKTYLITGGLGGFGLAVSQWMVEKGVKNLALVGRSGASRPEAKATVSKMKAAGVNVQVFKADITDYEDSKRLFAELEGMPPLDGIIHSAAVLDDSYLSELDLPKLEKVMNPKAIGAWHMHHFSKEMPLSHFVMFSSLASTFGNAAQGNYVAANYFLNMLSEHRHAQGLSGLSIEWGVISDVGMAARDKGVMTFLASQGLHGFTSAQALSYMESLMVASNEPCVGIYDVDWAQVYRANASVVRPYRFEEVLEKIRQESNNNDSLRNTLQEIPDDERYLVVTNYLVDVVAKTLQVEAENIDAGSSLPSLGVDSMMAGELLVVIANDLELTIPMAELLQSSSIETLASDIANRLSAALNQSGSGDGDEADGAFGSTGNGHDSHNLVGYLKNFVSNLPKPLVNKVASALDLPKTYTESDFIAEVEARVSNQETYYSLPSPRQKMTWLLYQIMPEMIGVSAETVWEKGVYASNFFDKIDKRETADVALYRLPLGPLGTNTYIVQCKQTGKGIIVDPSWNGEFILDVAAFLEIELEAILITHGHFDHVGGLRFIQDAKPELPTYINQEALKALEISEFRATKQGFVLPQPDTPSDRLDGGDSFTFGNIVVDVLDTPGHGFGHISFYIESAQWLFCGDTLFRNSVAPTNNIDSDFTMLIDTIRNIFFELPNATQVLPGHGIGTTIGYERLTNPFLSAEKGEQAEGLLSV